METKATTRRLMELQREDKVKVTLTYQGWISALKLYMKYANCRLREAKVAVTSLGNEIEPGQAK